MDQEHGRDRLRELLDAVLDEEHETLGEMAGGAYASPYHFSRQLTRGAGEPPVAMRRQALLEAGVPAGDGDPINWLRRHHA